METAIVSQLLELVKKKEISRDAARKLIETTRHMPKQNRGSKGRKMAIIGIASQLPGATTFEEFWQVLIGEQDHISELPQGRVKLCKGFTNHYREKYGISKEKPYWDAAWLSDIDRFDPAFFGITPGEAKIMDPQQRRFLQTAYECFEDAGYAGQRIKNSKTGVYVSAAMVNYADALSDLTPLSVPANVPAFVGSRISYTYNLTGPSFVISSTCVSSMMVLHQACIGLMNGDCDLALVGGINIFPFPINGSKIFMNAAGIMSEQQRCRPFDQNASGIGRGEGSIALLMKPLEKAIADNDNIHAVIMASTANNDGTSAGITAPNPKAHTRLIVEAWELAGIEPEQIDYIEAHGTGTHLGDPIEINGITEAVKSNTDKRQFIALGSVKGNIGHLLDGAAGLSGIVKAMHVLKKGVVPPTLNMNEPNQHINFIDSPVFTPTFPWDLRSSKKADEPLRAGVSCFGFNGTNVHVVLEEAPKRGKKNYEEYGQPFVFPFSAKTKKSLYGIIEKYAQLETEGLRACDVAYTLATGREHFDYRIAIIAKTVNQLVDICKSLLKKDLEKCQGVIYSEEVEKVEVIDILAEDYIAYCKCAWHRQFKDQDAMKVSLPTYAFDEKSYWLYIGEENRWENTDNTLPVVDKVLRIAESILEIEDLKPEDDFLSVGGNSLSGLQFVSRLKKAFHGNITLEDVFTRDNFKEIADMLNESEKVEVFEVPITKESCDYPVSFAQNRLWIVEQFTEDKTVYNTPFVFEIEGDLDEERLKHTFDTLSMRHEVLRTIFLTRNNKLRQRILDKPNYLFEYKDISKEIGAKEKALEFVNRWKSMAYDIQKGPLFRIIAYKCSGNETILSIMMHHIIIDGWSLATLSDEMLAIYNMNKSLDHDELPEIKRRYIDYCAWQSENFTNMKFEKQEKYWMNILRDNLPVTEIQGDKPRPDVFRFSGNIHRFDLDSDLIDRLKSIAKSHNGTLYMVLVASVFAFIHQMNGAKDMVIGTPVSGRNNEDLEKTLGLFANTVALRVQHDNDDSFKTLLEKVRKVVLEGFEHQDYPFDLLVDRLKLARDTSRSPIFNINVALQNFKFDTKGDNTFRGAKAKQILTTHRTSKWDLEFEFVELQNGELYCNLEYYDGIYSDTFIKDMVKSFEKLLHLITEPELENLPVQLLPVNYGVKRGFMCEGNTAIDGDSFDYINLIVDKAYRYPNSVALRDEYGDATYKELIDKSSILSKRIQKHGREGSKVIILTDNNRYALCGMLASVFAGMTFVPVASNTPRKRLQDIVEVSKASIILTEKKYYSVADLLLFEKDSLEAIVIMDEGNPEESALSQSSELMSEDLWNYFAKKDDTDIEVSGWTSSYTGESFREVEMKEYVDNAVSKISQHLTSRSTVFEIGCGSGLTTFGMAPKVSKYFASDLSSDIIERNRITAMEKGLSNILFSVAPAHEVKFPEDELDAVIINSVIHCFPNYGYLRAVINESVKAVKEGGIVFLGDLLDLSKKNEFTQSLLDFKAKNLDKSYQTKLDWDHDLFVSQGILKELIRDMDAEIRIDFSRKKHSVKNELTEYRFDAVLYIEKKNSTKTNTNRNKKNIDGLLLWSDFEEPVTISLPKIQATQPAYILFTSGSTGVPKGVAVSHANLNNYLTWAKSYYTSGDDKLNMPFYTSISFDLTITSIFLPLLTGGRVISCTGEIDQAFDNLSKIKEKIALKGTPKQVQLLLERNDFNPEVECFILGGEALPIQLCELILKRFPRVRIVNEYGPTEATVGTIVHEVTESDINSKRIHAPIGRPISNTTVYILNESGEPVPPYGVGEVVLAGDSVALGYIGSPTLTREKFIANHIDYLEKGYLYKTGDIGQMLPNGNILCFGRKDRMVKVRGLRVELEEIESHLQKVPGVKSAAVILYRDEVLDIEHLCAYLQCDQKIDEKQIRMLLSRQLPESLIPSIYEEIEEIPIAKNGKVDRGRLHSPKAFNFSREKQNEDQWTEKQHNMVNIWRELLGHHVNSIDEDFFKLGGDSIKALRMLSKAKEHGLYFGIKDIFEHRTIRELSEFCDGKVTTGRVAVTNGQIPLAPMQKWFFEQYFKKPHYWNLSMSVRIPNDIRIEDLENTFRQVILSHEALLTWFDVSEGKEPKAYVDTTLIDTFEIQVHDVSNLPDDKVNSAIAEVQFKLQDDFALERRLPIFPILFKTKERPILSFFAHHLVVDGVSWRIFLEDMERTYEAICRGEKISLLPSTQFSQWTRVLESEGDVKEVSYWDELNIEDVHPLCLKPVREDYGFTDRIQIRKAFSEETTKLFLKARSISEEFRPDAVITSSFGRSFNSVFGGKNVMFYFEGHGRDDRGKNLELSRTIGWFTTMFPIKLDTTLSSIEILKESNEILENVGSGVEFMVARWIKEPKRLTELKPSVLVNYLGRFDGDIATKKGRKGVFEYSNDIEKAPAIHPMNQLTYLLELNLFVLDGQLQASLEIDPEEIKEEDAHELLKRMEEEINTLCSGKEN